MYGFQVGDNRSSRFATTAGNALFCASEHQRQPVAMLCFAHLSTIIIKQWHCKEPAHHVQDVQSWIRIVVISMGGAFILQNVTKTSLCGMQPTRLLQCVQVLVPRMMIHLVLFYLSLHFRFFLLIGMSRLPVRAVLLNVPCFVISLISSDIDMNLWFLS